MIRVPTVKKNIIHYEGNCGKVMFFTLVCPSIGGWGESLSQGPYLPGTISPQGRIPHKSQCCQNGPKRMERILPECILDSENQGLVPVPESSPYCYNVISHFVVGCLITTPVFLCWLSVMRKPSHGKFLIVGVGREG